MCAIVGSFNKDKLKELFELNAYRGQLSYSLATFDEQTQLQVLMQDKGKMPEGFIDKFPANYFYIGHSQAPTTESTSVHPAGSSKGYLLWHNGIVKQKELNGYAWDTQYILNGVTNYGWDFLSQVDGTFACAMYADYELYIFRNEISPLFVDNELNISSTKFENSKSLEPNKVFKIDVVNKQLIPIATFVTKENPYYFD